jgi:predicted RNase H-like HicB family nuclease
MRKEADLYQKIVFWSDEDNCFIGMCPELAYGGVHGDDPIEVFKEISAVAEEAIEIFKQDGKPLPVPKGISLVEAV